MGTGARPSLLGWSRHEGSVLVPRGCTSCRQVLHPQHSVTGGWGGSLLWKKNTFIKCPSTWQLCIPSWVRSGACPEPGCCDSAVALCLPWHSPMEPGRSPGTPRRWSRQLAATPAPQPLIQLLGPREPGVIKALPQPL